MERYSLIGKLIGLPAYSPMLDTLCDPTLLLIDHLIPTRDTFNHASRIGSFRLMGVIVQHGCHSGALIHVRGPRLVHIRDRLIMLGLLLATA